MLDTRVKLIDDQNIEFVTVLIFTADVITMRNKYNGANNVDTVIPENTASYG